MDGRYGRDNRPSWQGSLIELGLLGGQTELILSTAAGPDSISLRLSIRVTDHWHASDTDSERESRSDSPAARASDRDGPGPAP
eukprot:2066262-Rhodomonas_salina.5